MASYHVVLFTDQRSESTSLLNALDDEGVSYELQDPVVDGPALNGALSNKPDAVLVDMEAVEAGLVKTATDSCHDMGLPVITVLTATRLGQYDPSINPDDLIVHPFPSGELKARLGQVIFKNRGPQGREVLKVGDLHIDFERYEVSLAGKKVLLTYKEYQMLVLLASNPGKVYSRENLLSQVWGYDYFGGTRTVDVHVRRLRSKIENANHSFIETIWNVGYRFNLKESGSG